jgi:hypothetical protein
MDTLILAHLDGSTSHLTLTIGQALVLFGATVITTIVAFFRGRRGR